jgi:hypothetical protein
VKRIHYAGALRVESKRHVTLIFAGGAACTSGERAERIALDRANTEDPAEVTCGSCLRRMAQAGVVAEA